MHPGGSKKYIARRKKRFLRIPFVTRKKKRSNYVSNFGHILLNFNILIIFVNFADFVELQYIESRVYLGLTPGLSTPGLSTPNVTFFVELQYFELRLLR